MTPPLAEIIGLHSVERKIKSYIYSEVALPVHVVSTAVELLEVAEVSGVKSADVVTRAVAERRRSLWIACAENQVVSGAANLRRAVVTAAVQEVATKNRVTRGGVVQRSGVVIVAFVVDEVLAVSCRIVTAVNVTMTKHTPRPTVYISPS